MSRHELEMFLATWSSEAQQTLKLLRALPQDQYDFRPVPGWRSLGELAWHLAESDAYFAEAAASGKLGFSAKLAGLERPRSVAELAPGYERIHREAFAKVRSLAPEALDRTLAWFDGSQMRLGDMLWWACLHHMLHHRGELVLLCRLAGGTPPGLYGPNMEETASMKAARASD